MKLWKYSGTFLTWTGIIHTIYAFFIGKDALGKMLGDGLADSVGEDYERGFAFLVPDMWDCTDTLGADTSILYKERAKTQRASKIFVLRGEILDRNGFKLAVDETSFDVYAHRKYYDYPPEVLADKLHPFIGGDKNALIQKLSSTDSVILVKKSIPRKSAESIRALDSGKFLLRLKINALIRKEALLHMF